VLPLGAVGSSGAEFLGGRGWLSLPCKDYGMCWESHAANGRLKLPSWRAAWQAKPAVGALLGLCDGALLHAGAPAA